MTNTSTKTKAQKELFEKKVEIELLKREKEEINKEVEKRLAAKKKIDDVLKKKREERKIKQQRTDSKLKRQQDKDREMVKGIFRFHEVPGGYTKFCFKKYKDDSIETYEMHDGEIYTVPFAVARHLNVNGWYPVHSHTMDEDGKPSVALGKKVQRFSFQSLEFVDISDPDSVEPQNMVEEIFEMKP